MNKKKKSNNLIVKNFWLSTTFLFNSSFLIGSLIVLLGFALSNHPHGQPPSDSYSRTVLLLGFPWIIFACIVVIIRKEVPRLGLRSITGGWAVFQGILGLVASGSVVVILLYTLFQEFFSK